MANVYVEALPKGRVEGNTIDDYVVEDHADHGLGTISLRRKPKLSKGPRSKDMPLWWPAFAT
jgi:hypothetical protein